MELTELVVIPLLEGMGFSNIRRTHGPLELGKDLVFCRDDPLTGGRHYSMTIKAARLTGSVSSSRGLRQVYHELRKALDEPLFDVVTHSRVQVDCAYVLTPYGLAESAIASIQALPEYDTGRIRIIDGPSLLSLSSHHLPSLIQSLPPAPDEAMREVVIETLVGKPALSRVLSDFGALLSEEPEEARVQKFIEDNGVLLHRFSPRTIVKKAPILNLHQTDFAIMSETSELLLVEIERPSSRLLRKDGGRSADMTHAFDQVNDWLDVVRNHRETCIQSMRLCPQDVSAVRGVVIMGRDAQCTRTDLRKLKATDFGEVALLTYDDLLGSLRALIRSLEGI